MLRLWSLRRRHRVHMRVLHRSALLALCLAALTFAASSSLSAVLCLRRPPRPAHAPMRACIWHLAIILTAACASAEAREGYHRARARAASARWDVTAHLQQAHPARQPRSHRRWQAPCDTSKVVDRECRGSEASASHVPIEISSKPRPPMRVCKSRTLLSEKERLFGLRRQARMGTAAGLAS